MAMVWLNVWQVQFRMPGDPLPTMTFVNSEVRAERAAEILRGHGVSATVTRLRAFVKEEAGNS